MAGRKIGGAIVLEGASKYNSDLKQIKSNLTVLRSEMKLANASHKESMNTTEALAKKGELLGKMYTEVSKKVETYGKMYEDAAKKQRDASQDIDKYSKELEKAKTALSEMKQEGVATDKELEEQQKKVDNLSNKLQKSEKAYETAGQKMNQYKTAGNNAKTELTQLDSELKKNDRYMQEAKQSTDGTAKSIDNLGKETAETKDQVSVFGDVLKANLASEAIISGVKMIANGIKNVATAAMDMGASFDAGMSKVAAVSGATGADLDALRNKAKEMGATTMFSASEAAEALNYMAMAGWKTDQMISGLDGIMNLAAASGADLATTSDIVTDALTAFGLAAEDSGHFADVLAAASSNANTNVEMMGETFKYAAPVAGALGMSVEDTAVAIGLMANSGIKASQAGTSLRKMLLEMGGDIKVSSEAMGDMVIYTTNADGSMRDLNDILVDLRSAFSGMTEAEKASNAEMVFGKTAVAGVLAVVNAGEKDFQNLTKAINNADGAAAKMAATMMDNLKGDVTIMNSALEGLGIAFEECFDDSARSAVQGATKVIGELQRSIDSGDMGVSLRRMGEAFEDLSERTLDFAMDALPSVIDGLTWMMDNGEVITSIITGMITAQLAQKTVTPIVTACQAAYIALTTAEEGAAVAQGTLNAVMASNPIGLIVTALGFAVGALATYSALTGDAASETEELANKSRTLNDEMERSAASRAENRSSMSSDAETARKLANELEGLQKKTSLTNAEQMRQKEIVSELNSLMPTLNLAIDEQTGKLNMSTKALKENVDELMNLAMVQAAQEDLTRIGEDMYQAEKRINDIEKELLDTYNLKIQTMDDVKNAYDDLTASYVDASGNISNGDIKAAESAQALGEELLRTRDNLNAYKEEFATVNEFVNENTEVTEENAAAQEALTASSANAAAGLETYSDEAEKATEKLRSAVEQTVTSIDPMFSELATTSETTLAQVSANLEKNAQAAEKFADTVTEATQLSQYGTDDAFTNIVNTLAQKGPEATGLLQELVDGARGNTEEFQTLIENMSEYMSGENSIASAVTNLSTEVTAGIETTQTAITDGEAQITETLSTEGENQKTAVETTTQDITELAEKGVEDTVKAVTENAPQVTKEVQTVANDSLKAVEDTSGKYRAAGGKLMKELAAGIKAESSAVRKAMQETLQTAVDNLDISGLTSRIDRVLGSKLKG